MVNNRFIQVILALLPLLVTPLVFYALAYGWLNLGGGEKDVIFIFPWAIWSLIFAITGLVLIFKGRSAGYWITRSLAISIGLMLALFIVTFMLSYFDIL